MWRKITPEASVIVAVSQVKISGKWDLRYSIRIAGGTMTTNGYLLIGWILSITIGFLAAIVATGPNWKGLAFVVIGIIIAVIVQRVRREQ